MASAPAIIALIDGSVYSASICDHASWLANQTGASVAIIHTLGRRHVSSAPSNLSGSIGLGARTALLEELAELDGQKAKLAQKRGRAILEDAEQRISQSGVAATSSKLRIGEFVETVLEMESAADMIIIGKRGEAADFDTLHLGSNLERLVRASSRPVLVAAREFRPIKRVLVAFGGGNSVLKAIDYIANSHAFRDLEFHLLTAGNENTTIKRQQGGAAALLSGAGYKVTTAVVDGQPEEVIAAAVKNDGFDLLLMGAYGHSRIRNLIIGSTTTEMIRSCKIPVVLFR